MKKHFTEEQITYALRQAESGTPVPDICRQWYRPARGKDQSALRMKIREIAYTCSRFGYQRIQVMLRRQGWLVNKKRVRRLYRLEGCSRGCAFGDANTCACIEERRPGLNKPTSVGACEDFPVKRTANKQTPELLLASA